MRTNFQLRRNGFTLVEILIVTGLATMVGGIAYIVLNTGLILFAKNTSTNVSHQQARMAMLQMQREMYQAVSPIRLTDEDGNTVGGNGPAAGVSFHVFAAGPLLVTARANKDQKVVSVNLGTYLAKKNDRLVITSHDYESDLAVTPGGTGVQSLTMVDKLDYPIEITDLDPQGHNQPKPVYALITERISYRVKAGKLIYEGPGNDNTILASDITSPQPFARSKNIDEASNPRFMAAINLSFGKVAGSSTYRHKASSMILNAEVPARAIICLKP